MSTNYRFFFVFSNQKIFLWVIPVYIMVMLTFKSEGLTFGRWDKTKMLRFLTIPLFSAPFSSIYLTHLTLLLQHSSPSTPPIPPPPQAVDGVGSLESSAEENFNRTFSLLDDIQDRISRLNDGENKSRYAISAADQAIKTIKRLKNWLMQPLLVRIKIKIKK